MLPSYVIRSVLVTIVTFAYVLTAAPTSQAQEVDADEVFSVSGRILSAEDGSPLQYAVVGFPELRSWGLSEADGAFEVQVAGRGTYGLIVLKRGYYFMNQAVSLAGPAELAVELEAEREEEPVGPGRLIGRVLDEGSGSPLGNVTVRVVPTGQETSTDRLGRFLISDVSAGAVLVEFERMGYETRADTVASFPGVTLSLEAHMAKDPIELPGLTVEVWPRFLEAAGFYRRAERGSGHRFGYLAMESRNAFRLSNVLQEVPGVRVERNRFGDVGLSTRGRAGSRCALGVYVDGMRTPGFGIDEYPVEAIQAAEVYTGLDVPLEYHDACGVVLIWTRRN